jgi:hypothetical protein
MSAFEDGELATYQACARLTAAFAVYVDQHRYDDLISLFTEDCVFDRPGALLNGRGELRAFMERRPGGTVTRHTCAPPVLDQVTAQSANGVTYLTFFEGEPSGEGPATLKQIAIAEYHDQFKRTSEGWRIARRRVVPTIRHVVPS